jgi:hypothetical protein
MIENNFKKIVKNTFVKLKHNNLVDITYYGRIEIIIIKNIKYEIEIFNSNYDYRDFYCTNEMDDIKYIEIDKNNFTYLFRKLTDKLIKHRIWLCEEKLKLYKKKYI